MKVKDMIKHPIQFLMALILPLLLISASLPRTTFASQVGADYFTIEAGQIQGVMLPPKIVFVDPESAHPRPAVQFHYQEATITGMTLYKQLDTGNGPMLVKIQASEPIHVTNLSVTATSFSFTGACLDFSHPAQAIVMNNVTMQATAMTSDAMASNGLTLATEKGDLPVQNQGIPSFLQSIMNENSFSSEKQKALEIESGHSLLMCPASNQGSPQKTGVLPTGKAPSKLVKQVAGFDPAQLSHVIPPPSDLLTKTDPVLKTVKIQMPGGISTGVTKTVGQVVKKATDPSTVTKTIGQVGKTATDPSTVTKTVDQVVKTATDTTKSVTKTVTKTTEQLQLEKDLTQLQSDWDATQRTTQQLTSKIKSLSDSITASQTTFSEINTILSNPFNLLKVGEELQALGQLNNNLTDSKTQLDQLNNQEKKEQQVYQDIKKRAEDLGSNLKTDDLKTALDKNQTHLTSLAKQLSTLKDGVQALLNQFS